jgi:hypothetical protein
MQAHWMHAATCCSCCRSGRSSLVWQASLLMSDTPSTAANIHVHNKQSIVVVIVASCSKQ